MWPKFVQMKRHQIKLTKRGKVVFPFCVYIEVKNPRTNPMLSSEIFCDKFIQIFRLVCFRAWGLGSFSIANPSVSLDGRTFYWQLQIVLHHDFFCLLNQFFLLYLGFKLSGWKNVLVGKLREWKKNWLHKEAKCMGGNICG